MSPNKDALRSRVNDLQTHCWPADKNAIKEIIPGPAPLFTTRECPPLCPVPVDEVMRRNPSKKFRDITGLKYSRLTVVGLLEFRGCGRSLWVCRCECGRHEPRNFMNIVRGTKSGKHSECHYCAKKRGSWDGKTDQPFNGKYS